MNKHISAPAPDGHTSLLDNLSDTFINAFSKVRKPDERFLDMREGIDKFEEGLGGIERLASKERSRTEDLAGDYVDMAAAYQGLGYLESGITDPLNRFAERMLDFSTLLKQLVRGGGQRVRPHRPLLSRASGLQDTNTLDPFLAHTHSLMQYSQSHRSVIKMRDQKQLDFEELSAYLSAVVAERDRLAALSTGHVGGAVGLGTYLRDQVDRIRGTDDVHTRRERMRKLDGKIKEVCPGRFLHACCSWLITLPDPQLQDAVTTAHEVSTDFNEAILKEHAIFEISKRAEMQEMLGTYADGQVDLYRKAIEDWDRVGGGAVRGAGLRTDDHGQQTDHSAARADQGGCVVGIGDHQGLWRHHRLHRLAPATPSSLYLNRARLHPVCSMCPCTSYHRATPMV